MNRITQNMTKSMGHVLCVCPQQKLAAQSQRRTSQPTDRTSADDVKIKMNTELNTKRSKNQQQQQ